MCEYCNVDTQKEMNVESEIRDVVALVNADDKSIDVWIKNNNYDDLLIEIPITNCPMCGEEL